MTAFMTGKLKVEGDMCNAMQLQSVLGEIAGLVADQVRVIDTPPSA